MMSQLALWLCARKRFRILPASRRVTSSLQQLVRLAHHVLQSSRVSRPHVGSDACVISALACNALYPQVCK